VFEFLSLQTCINSWAESLETPSHLCPGGPGAGAGGELGEQETGTWTTTPQSLSAGLSTGPVFSRIPGG